VRDERIPFRFDEAASVRFFDRNTVTVARDLIGHILARRYNGSFRLGRIVETEAYLGLRDPACHLYGGFTPRTQGSWGNPGVAYVFVAYGIHRCLNAITLSHDPYGGVLIRGVEPLFLVNEDAVQGGRPLRDGPGKVCRYFSVGRGHNTTSLTQGDLRILRSRFRPRRIESTRRIGISRAKGRKLRFVGYF